MTNAPEPEFDPDAPAAAASGLFGLNAHADTARVVIVPVPFDATTSYRRGTSDGPAAILAASHQVDLYDAELGAVHAAGIAMLEEATQTRHLNDIARKLALAAREDGDDSQTAVEELNRIGDRLQQSVQETVDALLARGQIVGTVGGEHSVAYGAICAHLARYPEMGVLHVDAHADLRAAYEGFTWSHASVMRNVLDRSALKKLVQVGIRDFGRGEIAHIQANPDRVKTFFDADLGRRQLSGTSFAALADEIVGHLPEEVYISFDVDGLDPTLCPNTGTPVPGGLSFREACLLFETVTNSGRRIVGFDLTEVAPGEGAFDDSWDANVGARLLYKLCGRAQIRAACPPATPAVG
ncbi:MAG: agmatinase family protein [Deltaproteobacteria bacterium]|nr:agmatinase family protein [Deltaproteobacteria bacterium]